MNICRVKIFIFMVLIGSIMGCNDVSNSDTLPTTDAKKFITDNKITFPENTTALEIYNCMSNKYGTGEHTITGNYSHTESTKLNGKSYSDTITKNIIKVSIYKSKTETTNSFSVDFITDNDEKISFCYTWQYSNTNAWNNNKSNGIITIIL